MIHLFALTFVFLYKTSQLVDDAKHKKLDDPLSNDFHWMTDLGLMLDLSVCVYFQ